MAGSLIDVAQQIVDGPWRYAARARTACAERRWAEFVDEVAPPAPVLRGRLDHRKCRRRAGSMFEGPQEATVRLIPVWAGDVPDEVPAATWYAVHAVEGVGEPLVIIERGEYLADASQRLDCVVDCRARRWRVGHVVETRSYSPEIELALRAGEHGVLENVIYELLSVEPKEDVALARPTLVVPAFSVWFEPRVAGLPNELVRAIRNLSITTDEEGNLIGRSA